MKTYRYNYKRKPGKDKYSKLMYDVFNGWRRPIEMKIDEQGRLVSMIFVGYPGHELNEKGERYRWVRREELKYLSDKLGLEVAPKNERRKHNSELSGNDRSTRKGRKDS